MKHTRAEQEHTFNIDQAARPARPSLVDTGSERSHVLLHTPAPRAHVPEPEPVTWRDLNGRPPEEWEKAEIKAARMRERQQEWRP